jgi:hypothetical protein
MTKMKHYKTNILYPRVSFVDGIGSVFNIAGNFYKFNYSKSNEEADRKALENDWGVIGNDLKKIFQTNSL